MVIFDCNGVLVDSEPIAHAVLADAFAHAGISLSAEAAASRFHGRRPADVFAAIERVSGKTLRRLSGRRCWRRRCGGFVASFDRCRMSPMR